MIKAMLMALLLAVQSPPAGEAFDLSPAEAAERLQPMVGREYEGGLTVTRIFAEGRTLVFVFDGPRGWRAELSPQEVSDIFTASFCEDQDFDYFVNGNMMRIDTTEGGRDGRTGPLVQHCGAPAPTQV